MQKHKLEHKIKLKNVVLTLFLRELTDNVPIIAPLATCVGMPVYPERGREKARMANAKLFQFIKCFWSNFLEESLSYEDYILSKRLHFISRIEMKT